VLCYSVIQEQKKSFIFYFHCQRETISTVVWFTFHYISGKNISSIIDGILKLEIMLSDDLTLDMFRSMCAAAWIMFLLIMKNIVLLVILAIQRRRNAIYRVPEDVNTFGAGQQSTETASDWSLAGRIQRVLANDTEYVPYFLALLVFIFCTITLTSQTTHHYLARVLVYGIIFTVGRYIHTISYLMKITYGRILGFLITVIMLFVISVDHVYYMSKRLSDYTPPHP
jgi:uncharacterized membrane protein YecN with MAPEG domain